MLLLIAEIAVVFARLAGFFLFKNGTQKQVATDPDFLVTSGQKLYATYCMSCHGDQDSTLRFGQAPPHNSEGHTWHHADAELKKWILEGRPYNMPAFKEHLNETDVEAILAFIKTWWGPDQRQTQAKLSAQYEEALKKYQTN